MEDVDIIGIPLGTRLQALVYIPPCEIDALYGRGGETHVWIAVKCRGKNYDDWQGTYLRIESNGRVTRVRKDDAYDTDDEFIIKEAGA